VRAEWTQGTFYSGNTKSGTGATSGGLNWWLARNRFYDPIASRWVNRDPSGYADGLSMYLYVRGNPWGLVDPTGLAPQPELQGNYDRINARDEHGKLGSYDSGNELSAFCAGYGAYGHSVPGKVGAKAKEAGNVALDTVTTILAHDPNGNPDTKKKLMEKPPLSDTFRQLEGNTPAENTTFALRTAASGGTCGASEMGFAAYQLHKTGDYDAFGDSMIGIGTNNLIGAGTAKIVSVLAPEPLAEPSVATPKVAPDNNVIVDALEKGGGGNVDAAIGGRQPVLTWQVAREFFKGGGDKTSLRAWLSERGGIMAPAASDAEAAALQAKSQAVQAGVKQPGQLSASDAKVAAGANKAGATVLTGDRRFVNRLNEIGQSAERYKHK
jgi:RHS repeat-associated protein